VLIVPQDAKTTKAAWHCPQGDCIEIYQQRQKQTFRLPLSIFDPLAKAGGASERPQN
jgi:hypothetical protein